MKPSRASLPRNRTSFGETAATTRQPRPAIPIPRLRESREEPRPTSKRRGSIVARATVDVDRLAGDEAAVVADQEEAGGGDLVDVPLTAQWNAGGARHPPLVPLGIIPAGIDAARGDHVGPDVLGGELGGQGSRQPHETHLRGRDVSASAAAGESAFASEEQNAPILVFDHRADCRLRAVERAIEHDAPNVLPVLHCYLGEGLVRPDRGG